MGVEYKKTEKTKNIISMWEKPKQESPSIIFP